ncbi:hypothetical protein F0562_024851 [Nyssa sinensis]|uniref:Uncharacterized protein n=1 Tax=Nyssa sinensis TaxID=561372 RepID=A0A5J5BIR9_9ASTE|nr:hypothetical protein F0562_024851 [Nyssa sinensis]
MQAMGWAWLTRSQRPLVVWLRCKESLEHVHVGPSHVAKLVPRPLMDFGNVGRARQWLMAMCNYMCSWACLEAAGGASWGSSVHNGRIEINSKLAFSGIFKNKSSHTWGGTKPFLWLQKALALIGKLNRDLGGSSRINWSCFSLEELQANENSIEELPSSVCNLVHLKSICLNNNNVKQIPQNLLKDCKALQNTSLHDNPISMDQFQQVEGFHEFEARRKKKFDKQIDSNVMISSKGLDEGVDP